MEYLSLGECLIPVRFKRTRNGSPDYRLRIQPDGLVVVSVPDSGSRETARIFIASNAGWVQENLQKISPARRLDNEWPDGIRILYFGDWQPARRSEDRKYILLGGHSFHSPEPAAGLRRNLRAILIGQSRAWLPASVREISSRFQLQYNRLTIRDQKSRWGSCSSQKNISLNWRLIQCPEWIRNYVILHELHHTRQLNHSLRFWRNLKKDCPALIQAERWLRDYSFLLTL